MFMKFKSKDTNELKEWLKCDRCGKPYIIESYNEGTNSLALTCCGKRDLIIIENNSLFYKIINNEL